MAEPTHVQPYGNQFKVLMDDGTSRLAFPTGGNLWIVTGTGGTPPDPGVGTFVWPFDLQWVTNEYGWRVLPNGETNFHNGIDFQPGGTASAAQGQEIKAMGDGVVDEYYTSGQLGNAVRINHGVHAGHALRTGYGHFQFAPMVNVGDTITRGQVIGLVGNTGLSFGDHLHLETWDDGTRINPRDWMAAYANS